ncbi:MAG TPA: hypothetical protein PLE82_07250 [Saccharofermentans sp.]|nr:hypothetical protein [Saccharofermentans sp.]
MVTVKYVLLESDGCKGIEPKKMTDNASCYDLSLPEDVWVYPHHVRTVPLLIAFDIVSPGYDIELFPRSSLQTKHNIISSTSIIDSDYKRGIHAILANVSNDPVRLLKGTRVVQFKIKKKYDMHLLEVDHIEDIGRGGLGSTDDK